MDWNRFLRRTKVSVILMGAALLALGIILFMNPAEVTMFITLALGWVLVIVGVVTLVSCCMSPLPTIQQVDFVFSMIELLLGLCILMWPGFFVSFIYVLLGILIIVTGVNDVSGAMDEKASGMDSWKLAMAVAVITLILGFLVVIAPFTMATTVMMIAGIALVFDGITEIVTGVRMPAHVD
ncbi:MAG: DUF308 domain-containing protein [Atopobiaceae bacterium]|jgi:uncharacterized membrane protein HdeD (DUF308 family)|nr:DUF308 domain-containing protein [Atopobiaceae bacterium]MCI2173457.1 DUF308 domain-containing protein [Atopobiaceae bacterium]MCI2207452.1 DUF308 domain-containing protein [Atopobiaceae bacterium]